MLSAVSRAVTGLQKPASTEAWANLRTPLLRRETTAVETRSPFPRDLMCVSCKSCVAVAVCADCGPSAVYCEDCTEAVHLHQNIFHYPQLWKVRNVLLNNSYSIAGPTNSYFSCTQDGKFQQFVFKNPRVLKVNHTCLGEYVKKMVCIDQNGRELFPSIIVLITKNNIGFQHLVNTSFCSCEPEAVTLVRYGLWPATPTNPCLAFHQGLLIWMQALLLEGWISCDAFCRAVEYRINQQSNSKPV